MEMLGSTGLGSGENRGELNALGKLPGRSVAEYRSASPNG